MADRQVKFWGPPEAERLIHDDIDEAIADILDDMHLTPISELPETIEVVGYAPIQISVNKMRDPLEDIIERLDEDYGDPDGVRETEITNKMRTAQRYFLKVVRDEYQLQCWACEEITRETINVRKWIEKNRREWLEDENALQRE